MGVLGETVQETPTLSFAPTLPVSPVITFEHDCNTLK